MSDWRIYAKKADFKEIEKKFGIDQVIARIIRNRDVIGLESVDMYLNGDIHSMYNPHLLKDADKAVKIILDKIKQKKKIRIIGDYDIDGVCSTCILYKALKDLKADVDYIVPDRITDGYGINEHLIDKAIQDKVDTIVTCDNGIAAFEQIKYAKEQGVTVIVTDHHDIPYIQQDEQITYVIPPADAVVNPKQKDCKYPFKLLCGAAVAAKVVRLMYEALGINVMPTQNMVLEDCMELMAIATVGDVVDLVEENRVIVKYGLKHIAYTRMTGLRSLIEECGLDITKLSSYHIGFVIGPCLNAGGRLDTAMKAIGLLLEGDKNEARLKALELKDLNEQRKSMTETQTNKAIDMIMNTELSHDNVLVVYLPDCHESIAGIIAGRLREYFYKPAIVITDGEDLAKGSGRSIDAYNMFEGITACSDLLTKFGGHPLAAGLSLPKENIDEFRERINRQQNLTKQDLTEITWIDVPMPVDYVTKSIIKQLEVLEPFGKGNEKPVFADKGLKVRSAKMIGRNQNVLKMELESEYGLLVQAVKFNAKQEDMPRTNSTIAIIYYPDINSFNGRETIQFIIKEIK